MPTQIFNNPYHNLKDVPQQPISSINGKTIMNQYLETGGLDDGYNYRDLGNKYNEHKLQQQAHREAYPVDIYPFMMQNPNNILPELMPRHYVERPNFDYLPNQPSQNPNYDLQSQKTYINPFLTTIEQYPTISPVYAGLYNSHTPLGTTYQT